MGDAIDVGRIEAMRDALVDAGNDARLLRVAGSAHVKAVEMGYVGIATSLSQRADIGWRFTIKSRISIAPTLGFGTREDIDSMGQLATTVRPQLAVGLELGWLR